MKEVRGSLHGLKRSIAVTMTAALIVLLGAANVSAEDKRLVNIYVDETEYTLSTTSSVVSDLLGEIGVELAQQDIVEPSIDTEITESPFNINVYRAKPALVIDGSKRTTVLTAHSSGKDIAEDAGLQINPRDIFSVERVDNFLEEQLVGLKVSINRSTPFSINLFGETVNGFTHKESIGEALEEAGIDLSEADLIEPGVKSSLTSGVVVNLYKEGITEVVEEEVIEFTEQVTTDDTLAESARVVETAGVNGVKLVTYEVLLRNGQEISRTQLSSTVKVEPVQQVVKQGPLPTPVLSSSFIAGGTKQDWMSAAGIPESQWASVDFLVSKESGWNPNAVNPSSGACGLGQQLPCGKWDSYGVWNDPVAALTAMSVYVQGYGGWDGAVAFWGCTGNCYSARTGGNVFKHNTWY